MASKHLALAVLRHLGVAATARRLADLGSACDVELESLVQPHALSTALRFGDAVRLRVGLFGLPAGMRGVVVAVDIDWVWVAFDLRRLGADPQLYLLGLDDLLVSHD